MKAITGGVAFQGRRGLNLGQPFCSWGFTAIPGSVYGTDPWQGKFVDRWAKADFDDIAAKGFDHIRLMIDPGVMLYPLKSADSTRYNYVLAQCDAAVALIRSSGLKVVLDCHPQVDQSAYYNGEWTEVNFLTSGSTQWTALKSWWALFAAHYAALYDPSVLMFELMNEPVPTGFFSGWTEATWNGTLAPELWNVVRAAAPNHTIAVGAAGFNAADKLLNLSASDFGPNTVYVFHPYDPWPIALQGSKTGGSYCSRLEWPAEQAKKAAAIATMTANVNASSLSSGDKTTTISNMTADLNTYYASRGLSYIQSRLDDVVGWCTTNSIPPDAIWAGEFGCARDSSDGTNIAADIKTQANWLHMMVTELNARGFRWSVFSVDWDDFNVTDGRQQIGDSYVGGKGTFVPEILAGIAPAGAALSHS